MRNRVREQRTQRGLSQAELAAALLGSRADERQRLVAQKARALAGVVALAAAYAGLVITVGLRVRRAGGGRRRGRRAAGAAPGQPMRESGT